MKLKDLLGEAYRDGMTLEEITSALEGIALPPNNDTDMERLRAAVTKANSEAADYKKQLRALQSEDEQKKAQEAEERAKLQEAYDALLLESNTSKHRASFLALGYDEKLAQEAAEALVSGDTAKVFEAQKKHQAALETKYKSERIHSMEEPTGGASKKMSVDDIYKISDASERQAAIAANLENFE